MTNDLKKFHISSGNRIRVGINFGNVLLAIRSDSGSPRGIAVDMAGELMRRLHASMELVGYDAAGRMADGAKAGEWDVAFLAADPVRGEEIDFTPPYLEVDTTYLIWADSPIAGLQDVDKSGVRISVSNKSAYDLFLSRNLTKAQLVRAPGPEASVDLFFTEKLDALAGLKPVLLEIAERHADTRVLDGHFMSVQQAIGVPKGREAAAAYLREFVADVKSSGFVAKTIEKNGIRGARVATL
jgi:polar amino acid transport system substrate-binding protein